MTDREIRDPILREAAGRAGGAPAPRTFIHLRVHSAYSLLEGALPLGRIIAHAVKDNAPAIAVTDTNNMFGALEFAQKAVKEGVQPIIGCQLAVGFVHVFAPANLVALTVGLIAGLLVAVLPGLTLVMGVVLALPFTYKMDVTAAIILLTAMYVSGTYAGAWTSILFRVPGEPIDVPLLWDGYTMARKGQAPQALGWTLLAALFGGLLAATVMVAL